MSKMLGHSFPLVTRMLSHLSARYITACSASCSTRLVFLCSFPLLSFVAVIVHIVLYDATVAHTRLSIQLRARLLSCSPCRLVCSLFRSSPLIVLCTVMQHAQSIAVNAVT